MANRLVILFGVALCIVAPRVLAIDVDKAVKDCQGCHGSNGVSECPDMPTIAGLSSPSHEDALFNYKDGARPCIKSDYRHGDTSKAATDMCAISKALSEEDIVAIAAWFAGKKYVATKQDFDADKAKAGEAVHNKSCKGCHSDGGSNPKDDAGILAGQPMGYLKNSFKEFAAGTREQPKKMKPKMDALSAADIDVLIHFYASQQ